MADLVGGKFPQSSPVAAVLAGFKNTVQSNLPARSNAEYLGFGGFTDGALAGTGVAFFVPVPVDVGVTISSVSLIIGGTGASTPTHQFAALYAGTGTAPALIGQSTDTTTAPIAASAVSTWTLTTPATITGAQAPNGFIYAGVSITASTVPTAAAVSTPTATTYQWNSTSGPLGLSVTAGSALAGTAAATIASSSAKAVAPIVIRQ